MHDTSMLSSQILTVDTVFFLAFSYLLNDQVPNTIIKSKTKQKKVMHWSIEERDKELSLFQKIKEECQLFINFF